MLRFNKPLVGNPPRGVHSLFSFLLVILAHIAAVESASSNTSVSLAVAAFNGVNFQLFRLDASGALLFSQAVNTTWQTVPDTIALTVKPRPNSPLGVVSWSPSGANGDTSIRAYYLDTTDKIIELVGSCQKFSCKWKNNNGLVGVSASASSGLAAALEPGAELQPGWGINVFYTGIDSRLSVARYTKDALWRNGTAIGPALAPGSSLAVSAAADQGNFQVYFHAADTKALSHVSFDNTTATWSPATAILPPTPANQPLPSLAAIHIAAVRPSRRLYFLNATRHLEAHGSADDGVTWSPLPIAGSTLPLADAPGGGAIAAHSWASKVRLFFSVDAALTEMSMKGTGQFYVMQAQYSLNVGSVVTGDGAVNKGAETKTTIAAGPGETTVPGATGTEKGGDKDEEKMEKKGGVMETKDIVGYIFGGVSTLFTVGAVVWKWRWLQSLWQRCTGRRKDTDGEEPLVKEV